VLYEREGIKPWPHCGRQATARASSRSPRRAPSPRRDTSGTGGVQADG
jgi:hypothetical protein